MKLLAYLATIVCGNLVATLHKTELDAFAKKVVEGVNNAQGLYYATDIGTQVNPEVVCDAARDFSSKMGGLNDLYYIVGFHMTEVSAKCHRQLPKLEDHEEIKKIIETPTNMRELYQGIIVSDALEHPYSAEAKIDALIELAKADDSVMAGSLAILSAVAMWGKNKELDLERVLAVIDMDDLFAQADMVDSQVSFNGDVAVTAFFVQAAFALSEYKDASQLSNDKLIGFGNFIAAGVRPVTAQESYYYVKLANMLSAGKYGGVVRVSLVHNRPIFSGFKDVAIETVDLAGHPRQVKAIARSITRVEDNEVILSNVEFVHPEFSENRFPDHPSQPDVKVEHAYVYNLMAAEPKAGYYDIELEVTGEKLLLTEDAIRLRVKVVRHAKLDNIKTAISTKKLGSKLDYKNEKFADASVDATNKVSVSFVIVSGVEEAPITAHQAFVTLTNEENSQSVTFIAEPNDDLTYFATFDVKEHLEFNGKHLVDISVGDAILYPGAIIESLGAIDVAGLKDAPVKGAWSRKYLAKYDKKEEKSHTFREPEPRPPVIISLVFTGLCAVPLVGLLIAWKAMGINVNKMESSFLPFHVAIASVFGLYFLYWYKLNMFTTLKYLALLGSVTFILGNKVLSALVTMSEK